MIITEGEHRPINPASLEFDGGDWDDDYVSFGDILDMGANSFLSVYGSNLIL